jgi:hypothetical protein
VHSKVGQGTEFVLAIPLSDAVRDSADQSSEASDVIPETAIDPAPQDDNNAQNHGGGAATAPIVPLAAGAPSAQTSRLRN